MLYPIILGASSFFSSSFCFRLVWYLCLIGFFIGCNCYADRDYHLAVFDFLWSFEKILLNCYLLILLIENYEIETFNLRSTKLGCFCYLLAVAEYQGLQKKNLESKIDWHLYCDGWVMKNGECRLCFLPDAGVAIAQGCWEKRRFPKNYKALKTVRAVFEGAAY